MSDRKSIFSDSEVFGVRTIEVEIYASETPPNDGDNRVIGDVVAATKALMDAADAMKRYDAQYAVVTYDVTSNPASLKFKMIVFSNGRAKDEHIRRFNVALDMLGICVEAQSG
mgnify:CR=1 FL=1